MVTVRLPPGDHGQVERDDRDQPDDGDDPDQGRDGRDHENNLRTALSSGPEVSSARGTATGRQRRVGRGAFRDDDDCRGRNTPLHERRNYISRRLAGLPGSALPARHQWLSERPRRAQYLRDQLIAHRSLIHGRSRDGSRPRRPRGGSGDRVLEFGGVSTDSDVYFREVTEFNQR